MGRARAGLVAGGPFPAAALVAWPGSPALAALAMDLVVLWGAAILMFLAGVRRGLSFRTPGCGWGRSRSILRKLAVLVLPERVALGLLLAGYASLWLLDPRAARRAEAPLYFARLRPWQMVVPVVCLGVVLVGADSVSIESGDRRSLRRPLLNHASDTIPGSQSQ